MLIDGFGIGGYRGFGDHVQRIAPCSKVNLIVGQNNSGKSNVLRLLGTLYQALVDMAANGNIVDLGIQPMDRHAPHQPPLRFHLAVDPTGPGNARLADKLNAALGDVESSALQLAVQEDGLLWFPFVMSSRSTLELEDDWVAKTLQASNADWGRAARKLSGQQYGDPGQNLRAVVRKFVDVAVERPDASVIPAVRRIGIGAPQSADLTGEDLIQRLAELERPSMARQDLRAQFDSINLFLRWVLTTEDARIEIPYERDTIHVVLNGTRMPLENLGTGVHEVLMLASWATILTNQVIGVEEPELHLHPLLQRKLLAYLGANTSNQYFMTTHSAHLLDQAGPNVFHVRGASTGTQVERAVTSAARVAICSDLGYRASDLVQANSVIWVEGPSDRIYVRWWLTYADPSLIEAIHYSIMFYGGRLLAHLAVDDTEVSDFISLKRINQHLAIIIDSDRPSKNGTYLNPTKRRVRDGFTVPPGFAWITKGREIESYISPGDLLTAVQSVHPGCSALGGLGDYDNRLVGCQGPQGRKFNADKVKVAHAVVSSGDPGLSLLGLGAQVEKLRRFVRVANGLD